MPYLSCFLIFFPEVCLLEAVLPYPPDRGVDSQEMTEEKLKGSGRSMIYIVEAGTEDKFTSPFSVYSSIERFFFKQTGIQ